MRHLALGLAGVAIAGAVAATAVVRAPVDGADAAMLDALRQATGLTIESNGAATVSYFPTPRIRIPAVSVAKPGEPPFAVARELVGAPSAASLVTGKLELAEITLEGADISLDRAPLDALYAGLRRTPGADGARSSFRIRDARLELDGRTVEGAEAGLAWTSGGGPLTVSGFGQFAGRPVEAMVTLSDPAALARGERAPLRARFEGGGARVMFDGAAIDADGPRVEGDLSARSASLRETLRWLGLPAPRKSSPLRDFSLTGRATADRSGLALAGAALGIEGGGFLGAGRLTVASGRPMIEATLDTDELNLDPYFEGIAPAVTEGQAWKPGPVSLKTVGAYDLDLRLSADEVRLGALRLGETAATVTMANGAFDVSIGEATAYGGTIGGRVSIERESGRARVRMQAEATGVALGEALAGFVEKPALTGALTGDLSLEGEGASAAEIVSSLKGRSDVQIAGGEMAGFSKSRTLALAGLHGPIDVQAASAAIRVEDGVARFEDVSVKAGGATLALAGEASLADLRIRLDGSVKPADGAWTLPIKVDGPLSAPKIRPNLSSKDPRSADRDRPAYAGK